MAPWSKGLLISTWVSVIPLPLVYLIVWSTGGAQDLVFNLVFVGAAIIYVIIYVFGPKGYSISPDGIEIKRTVGSILIPGQEIVEVQVVPKANLSRVIGNEGIFSYYGTFCEMNGEKVKVYSTRFDQIVRVKTKQQTYYLSPRDPNGFVISVRKFMSNEGIQHPRMGIDQG